MTNINRLKRSIPVYIIRTHNHDLLRTQKITFRTKIYLTGEETQMKFFSFTIAYCAFSPQIKQPGCIISRIYSIEVSIILFQMQS